MRLTRWRIGKLIRNLKVISLFSGAGGMALGLERVKGLRVEVMVDRDPTCCNTLRSNFKNRTIIEDDIRTLSAWSILARSGLHPEEVDLVTGGPPCQSFSRSNEGCREGLADEDTGGHILEFARMVEELRPRGFIFENVPGLASSNGGRDLEVFLNKLSTIGDGEYSLNAKVLNAADYGVPQKRRRLFVLGLRGQVTPEFPKPTHTEDPEEGSKLKRYRTAGDAIGDLDDGIDREGAEEVGGKWGHLLDNIPPGENYQYYTRRRKEELGHKHDVLFEWRSRFWTFLLKLDPDKPSTTIQANPGPYVGPFHWRNRPLTMLERKRLMSFPDGYIIRGTEREVVRQIGNAVPPGLAERVGQSMRDQMLSIEGSELKKAYFQASQGLHHGLSTQVRKLMGKVEGIKALLS